MTSIFGWIATGFSLIYKMPQIYVLYRSKKHEGLSIASLMCQLMAYGFYIAHGWSIQDWPIFFMGIISGLQSICLVTMFYLYKT